jgi:hypothetical protein
MFPFAPVNKSGKERSMESHNMDRKTALSILAALIPASMWAATGSQGGGERRKPPQEAFEACKDKSEGVAVAITTPHGATIKATCTLFDGQLVAVPEGPPPAPEDGERGGVGN